MFRYRYFGILSVLLPALCACGSGEKRRDPGPTTYDGRLSPLLENLGNLHRPVTTSEPIAQRFFDQGLTLTYAFNHAEAVRSFKEAARIDPNCAMAYWGQALAMGPNINDPAPNVEREREAYAAVRKAMELRRNASEVEQALIEALAARFSNQDGKDRRERNAAYAAAMAAVYRQFPNDPDVGTLYADAVMNTRPWDYWTRDGQPKPGTAELVAALEKVIQAHPDHPGAHHFYIHAVEASPDPDRAIPSADRLGGLVPAAGHLVHMPAHIYIRVGRYADATEANIRAIAADEDYLSQCRSQGIYPAAYYPHNIHFLTATLAMEGRSREMLEAARKVAGRHQDEALHEEGFGFPHLLRSIPALALVRFGRWDEILKLPPPGEHSRYAQAMWRFARGMAFQAKGRLSEARRELASLEQAAQDPALDELKIWDLNSLGSLARIAARVLAGEIAAREKRFHAAIRHLREAVELEDSLLYSEPPDWPNPVRHNLGAVLLEAGRADEAERVYREDLTRHRNNGWALLGLAQSLEAQGKQREAAAARRQFQVAWSRADIQLPASRF